MYVNIKFYKKDSFKIYMKMMISYINKNFNQWHTDTTEHFYDTGNLNECYTLLYFCMYQQRDFVVTE